MRSSKSTYTAVPALLALLACGPSGPDAQPVQLTFASAQATSLPCRGNGPCPPNQSCPPDPPCNPQYLVDARLHIGSLSGEPSDVRTFDAGLYDIHVLRVASPQAWSQPSVPFVVSPAGADLHLSFLTGSGAEVVGGAIRLLLTGTDAHGMRWELRAEAAVAK